MGPRSSAASVLRRLQLPPRLRAARLLSDESGSSLIELAVTLSLLGVPLLLATSYTAILLLNSNEVTNAAHAGALYGMRSASFAVDSSGIASAAQLEAPDFGTNLTVTPYVYYACSSAVDGTQYATQSSADAACNGGSSHTLQFLQVTASGNVTPSAHAPGFPRTVNLTATSVMEVQE